MRTARAGESGLARGNLIVAKSNGWSARHGYGSGGNISSAMRDFETESISNVVPLRLVYLDQRGFLGLIGDRPLRANAGPIENVQIIQPALCFQ